MYEGSIPFSPTNLFAVAKPQKYAPVAQQEEHVTFNHGVPSSSLGGRTNLIQKSMYKEKMLPKGCGALEAVGM